MSLLPFNFIGEGSEATPGLWNSPLSILSANIAGVAANQGSGLTFSALSDISTGGGVFTAAPSNLSGAVTIHANSNVTDYLAFTDSSNARSNYLFGSHAGGTADGLNLYDASGGTLIVSFSKQSVRFYQQVVGPVFDTGGALTGTYNAATFGTASHSTESRIQAAINQAALDGAPRVYLPSNFYPYSSSSVSFIYTVQMVREGGNWSVYDVVAYGASQDGTVDASAGIQSAISAAQATLGEVFVSNGTYLITTPVRITKEITVSGVLPGSVFNSSVTAITVNVSAADQGTGSAGVIVRNIKLQSASTATSQFLLDVTSGIGLFRDLHLKGDGYAGGWAGAVRLVDTNSWLIDNLHVTSTDGHAWPIGVDVCPGVSVNRGNVTLVGGFLTRCLIGVRIASGATGVVNNIQLLGTKLLYSGSGTTVAGIGVQAAASRLVGLYGVHLESFDKGVELTSVQAATLSNTRFVNFAVPSGGSTAVGMVLVNACKQVLVTGCEFDSGNSGVGSAISADATSHTEIQVAANRFVSVADVFTDNGTGSDRLLWTTAAGGQNFWFKDAVRVNQLRAIDGTSSSPGIRFSSEDSLGWYRSAGSTMALSYGKLGIDAVVPPSGNTLSVTSGILVSGVGRTDGVATRHTGGGNYEVRKTGTGTFELSNDGGSLTLSAGTSSDPMNFRTGDTLTTRLTIQSGGTIVATSPLLATSGSATGPGYGWNSETSLGFYRSAASTIAQSFGTLDLTAAVASLASVTVKSGANNSCGTAVLSVGSIHVANTNVKAGDLIFLTDQTGGGTLGTLEINGITSSSGFTITSTNVADTSTVGWLIIHPS